MDSVYLTLLLKVSRRLRVVKILKKCQIISFYKILKALLMRPLPSRELYSHILVINPEHLFTMEMVFCNSENLITHIHLLCQQHSSFLEHKLQYLERWIFLAMLWLEIPAALYAGKLDPALAFAAQTKYCNYSLFAKLPWPGDSKGSFRSSSLTTTYPPIYPHMMASLHCPFLLLIVA